MKKILTIGWKDLLLIFRDRSALILMLGAPFVLTLGLGLVTGAFSDNDTGTGLADIPVAIINLDEGDLSTALVDTFNSAELADLILPVAVANEAEARQMVDDDELAAVVIIPVGFTDGIVPQDIATGATSTTAVPITIYANPSRPISASVVESIVQSYINRIETGMTSIQVTMMQLAMNGIIPFNDSQQMQTIGQEVGERQIADMQNGTAPTITIQRETAVADDEPAFNTLAYFAPAMAVAFLLFTVTLGARSILDERNNGTLARLLATPTTAVQILGGKILGIFFSGTTQVGVLVLASTLLFGLYWGNFLGVVLLILTVALAATGYGLLLATAARNAAQISNFGTALMLVFGLIGGSFTTLPDTPMLNAISKITPNAWAIDGFVSLHLGGGLADITTPLLALLAMAAILFGLSAIIFSRRKETILG